jgi:hypothetical protein
MSTTTYDKLVSEMPAGLDRAMLRVVGFHTGKGHAIGRNALVKMLQLEGFDVDERQASQCIHDLRQAGHLICSAPGESGGYYKAATLAEFREFDQMEFTAKIADMSETRQAMRIAAREQFGDAVQVALI